METPSVWLLPLESLCRDVTDSAHCGSWWAPIGHIPWSCCCCCQVASVVSDSVRPHRWQSTRLRRPWDSPGKNTGVGCHFLLQCMKVKSLSRVWLFSTPWTAAYQAPPSMGFSRQEYWSLPSPYFGHSGSFHHENWQMLLIRALPPTPRASC